MLKRAYIVCMNTIIYFYQKRGIKEPEIDVSTEDGTNVGVKPVQNAVTEEVSGRQEYALIRVGFDLAGESWFGQNIGQTVPEEMQSVLLSEEPDMPCRKGFLGALQRVRWERREMKRRVEVRLRLEQALAARDEQIRTTEKRMRLAADRILKRAGGDGQCRYVCEENLKKCAAWKVWLNFLPVGEFDGYRQEFWVRQLLPHAIHPQFVILGTCKGIEALIESCAHRMKSLKWILKEQEYTPALRDFVEDFCVEYGLAIALRTVSGRTAYRKLRLDCSEPANILDFTEEAGFSASQLAEGSVWLDMCSIEEKKRYIAGRSRGVRYFSLKEKWKRGCLNCYGS